MADLEMMDCARRAMRLTTSGCGRLWESAQAKFKANNLHAWEGIKACHTCPIGARNAGREVEAVFEPAAAIGAYCPRCDRPAARLINRHLCISCYNRDREARVGRDAKGNRPHLCDQIHSERIVVFGAGKRKEIHVQRVVSHSEALFLVARDLQAGASIEFLAPVWLSPQLLLPLGLAA